MVEYNPLAYARAGRESSNALFDTLARTTAGRRLASGDQAGAQAVLNQYGMIDDASALQRQQMQIQRQERTDATADRESDMKWLVQAATGLRSVPYEQRRQAYTSQIRPLLQENGLDDDDLARVDAADLSDSELDALLGTLGGDVVTPYANDRSGRDGAVLRPDRYTGEYAQVYAPAFDPRQGASPGYMWTDETRTRQTYIPGGNADPSVAGGLAASRRAPPRASGGGGGSRGSSGGSAAAAPARKPWER